MIFNSYEFIFVFLPFTILGYYILNNFKLRKLSKLFLLITSLYFYASNNINYLLIIIVSILLNYLISSYLIESVSKTKSKRAMIAGVLLNFGILFYFKYFDFLVLNINAILLCDFDMMNLILPLGISFFTFQQVSYVIDSYKRMFQVIIF